MDKAEMAKLIAGFLSSVPDIEKLFSEGVTFSGNFNDYADYNEYLAAYRKDETEAKAYYKKVKAAIDKIAAKNPERLRKGSAIKAVAGISTGSANNEYFGFTYALETEKGTVPGIISFTLYRYVNSNTVLLTVF